MTHAARWTMVMAAATLAASGCGHRLNQVLLPEGRPELRLDRLRLDSPTRGSYSYLARWVGLSSGHRISHFVYAIDPVSVEAVDARWVRTSATQQVLTFPHAEASSPGRRSHVFVVRAVDEQGVMSDPQWFAVSENNIPPNVRITHPQPSSVFTSIVPPTIRIDWAGNDPDGQGTTLPVRYVFRLFGQHNPDFPAISDFITFAVVNPDSFRALYAPDFQGWQNVGPDTTSFEYTNLNPGSSYLFAVTGFDEAGDYDPVFSTSKNMLRLSIVSPGTVGPVLTMFNEVFNYTYPSGGYSNDVSRHVKVELPANQPVTVNWYATAAPGADVHWYRWALNPVDLTDQTPRTNEATDLTHWSAPSLTTTLATLGPFSPPPNRSLSQLLFIEAQDTNGLRSLGILDFTVRQPSFASDLLIVDDTRLRPDFAVLGDPGQVARPDGPWPTRAELDSFLFARGGYPWRSYPAGTLSRPGIFNGYRFDTLGTRGLLNGVPLSVLGRYRHVVWYTDETSASYNSAPSDPSTPITTLRMMSSRGQTSALAAYVQQGGKLWLSGGGAAFATLIAWNRPSTSALEYTAVDDELVPGRFMYDFSHWRAGIQMLPSVQARRYGTNSFGTGTNRPGRGWPPNPIPPTPPAPPNYALLPSILQGKDPATDPVPPLRSPDSWFYQGDYLAEYINRPTFIREDYNDDPGVVDEFSTLDTLYITSGGTALQNAPCMTYYHGRDGQPMVFSGFNLWHWRRAQCVGLVDWVLNNVWGLERDASAPREPSGTMAARPGAGTR